MLKQLKKKYKYIGGWLTSGEVYDAEVSIFQYGVLVKAGGKTLGYNNLIEFASEWDEISENDDE